MSTKAVRGFRELQTFLDQFAPKVEANIMTGALRDGARVIQGLVQENLQRNGSVASGELAGSVRLSTRRRRGRITVSVKAGNARAWYWRFVEFGTAAHVIRAGKGSALSFLGISRKSVEHPGARPKPFMRPAYDAGADAAIAAVGEGVKRRLNARGLNTSSIQTAVESEGS